MITKLFSLPDWQTELRQIGWTDAPTAEDAENAVRRELTRGNVTFAEQPAGTPVEKGCRVTLNTKSNLPKFNREKTVITVGGNLYDASIEELLCGMVSGESGVATVKGEKVEFTVLKVEKKVYPPLGDELVQNLQIDGIGTLEAYRRYMEREVRGNYASALCLKLLDRLLAAAKIDTVAEEDITKVIDREYEPLCARFSLDTMTPEEWKEGFGNSELQAFYAQIYPDVANLFGTTGKESYYESRKEVAAQTVRTCLMLRSVLQQNGDETDPTKSLRARETLLRSMEERILNMIYGG